jgi:hypothetical protein
MLTSESNQPLIHKLMLLDRHSKQQFGQHGTAMNVISSLAKLKQIGIKIYNVELRPELLEPLAAASAIAAISGCTVHPHPKSML